MENRDFMSLMERMQALSTRIDNALEELKPKQEPYQSEQVNELYAALSKAQSNMPPIRNNKTNPWFDSPYADIFEITSKIYPVLGAQGLSISQQPRITDDGGTILYTRLCHSSGQWSESRLRVIPPKNDSDSFESTFNRLRRSMILSILGIGIQNDPLDDDGEVAMVEARAGLAKAPTSKSIDAKKQEADVITKEQREEIEYELGEHTDLAEEMMNRCHIRSLADMPKSQFRNAITFIRKNKSAREGKPL